MPQVQMPDGQIVEMPDELTPELATRLKALQAEGTKDLADRKHSSEEYEAPSILSKIGRQAGLAARATAQGVASLPNMVGDAVNRVGDAVSSIPGFGAPWDAKEREEYLKKRKPTPSYAERQGEMMTRAGLPEPETRGERIAQSAMTGLAGSVATMGLAGAAQPLTMAGKGIQSVLTAAPATQALSGATSGVAAQGAAEAGGGRGAQVLAGLAGAIAPSAIPALGAKAARSALRGGDANVPRMQERIADFEGAGASPSAGQVSGSRMTQAAESILANVPGGAGVMAKKAATQAEEIGATASKIADDLSKVSSPAVAGRVIERGLSGEGGFVSRFKSAQKSLYDRLDEFVPKDAPVKVENTTKALAAMNQDIPGAEAISKFFQNARLKGIQGALEKDIGGTSEGVMVVPPNAPTKAGGIPTYAPGKNVGIPGGSPTNEMPYEAIKKLRSMVGGEIDNASLVSDVPRSKWKALYAALSQDLDGAAVATGDPKAVHAMNRANQFSAAGYKRIEDVLDKITSRNIPEDVYKAATSVGDMQAGATKVATVMKSLSPAERDVVKSAFIRRMGQAAAGAQDAEGGVFSSQKFLTDWNKMSPEAKSVMFASEDGALRKSLDHIANVASNVKEGSKAFANPSGTAATTARIAGAGALGTAIATGQMGTAGLLLGGATAANLTARVMTNPKFVDWLAKATKVPPESVPSALNALQRHVKGQPEDVQEDARKYADSVLQLINSGG